MLSNDLQAIQIEGKNYDLRPVVVEFQDPQIEADFVNDRYATDLRQGFYAFLGIGILLTISCIRDYVGFTSSELSTIVQLNSYRLFGALVGFALAAVVRLRPPRPEQFHKMILLAGTLWTVIYAVIATYYYLLQGESGSTVVFPLLALMSALFLGTTVRYVVATLAMILLVSVITHAIAMQLDPTEVFENAVLVMVLIWAGIPFSLVLQRARRESFASLQRLNQSVEKLETENQLRQEAEQQLLVHRDNLEELVQQRTLELGKSQEQLLRSQKMESIGQLAGGIAHDFNNLLHAMLGYGEIASQATTQRVVKEDLEQLLKAGTRASVLVQQLLAFSRRQILELSEINLDDLIADMAGLIQPVVGEHIQLDRVVKDGPKMIRADQGQIEQVLMNLCVNARDAMTGGGTLVIESKIVELDQDFCRSRPWTSPGSYALLNVVDTGCGMDKETQGQMFEPFFTTKEQGKGTGLGLSTVFGIVRQHQGVIEFESEPGLGTSFSIFFPLSQADVVAVEEINVKTEHRGTGTILVADDDVLVRDVTRRMLESAGYTLIFARDGEEAIRLFDEHRDEIDLALLDVVMPKLGGRAVADHIVSQQVKVPILFSSGYNSDAIHTDFVLDEDMQLILKPYDREALLARVQELVQFERH
jgi:signal transduction histidine kinase/ActR/RegA family two-component response regulator